MDREHISNGAYEEAIQRGEVRLHTSLLADEVRYDPDRDLIILVFSRPHWELSIERTDIAEFASLPRDVLKSLELSAIGDGIDLDVHDIHIDLVGLIRDILPEALIGEGFPGRGTRVA